MPTHTHKHIIHIATHPTNANSTPACLFTVGLTRGARLRSKKSPESTEATSKDSQHTRSEGMRQSSWIIHIVRGMG
ncbi:hypothetical protein EON63_00265 [archaeon]|nr:MAG: hypothetical protein EON63_00265 [archaeon]